MFIFFRRIKCMKKKCNKNLFSSLLLWVPSASWSAKKRNSRSIFKPSYAREKENTSNKNIVVLGKEIYFPKTLNINRNRNGHMRYDHVLRGIKSHFSRTGGGWNSEEVDLKVIGYWSWWVQGRSSCWGCTSGSISWHKNRGLLLELHHNPNPFCKNSKTFFYDFWDFFRPLQIS